jgi:hypothetical protein
MTIRTTALAFAVALVLPLSAPAADLPTHGMSKAQVRAQFGAPEQIKAAVGQPPISRWLYDDFTVYFENDTALHSVMEHPTPAPAAEAKPDTQVTNPPAPTTPAPGSDNSNDNENDNDNGEPDHEAADAPAPAEPAEESNTFPAGGPPRAERDGNGPGQPGRFRFDPATGRIVVTDESAPVTHDNVAPAANASPAPTTDRPL